MRFNSPFADLLWRPRRFCTLIWGNVWWVELLIGSGWERTPELETEVSAVQKQAPGSLALFRFLVIHPSELHSENLKMPQGNSCLLNHFTWRVRRSACLNLPSYHELPFFFATDFEQLTYARPQYSPMLEHITCIRSFLNSGSIISSITERFT